MEDEFAAFVQAVVEGRWADVEGWITIAIWRHTLYGHGHETHMGPDLPR